MNMNKTTLQPSVNKSRDEQWLCNFRQIQTFYQKHGHLTVPNKTLSQWLTYQRLHAKTLTDKQLMLLDSINYNDAKIVSGFCEKDVKAWETKCVEVEKWVLEHGSTSSLPGALRHWLTRQKRKFHESKLDRHKQERLESIGIDLSSFNQRAVGDATKEKVKAEWNENFEKLERYRKIHGHCNVPFRYAADPSLGLWVSNQRTRYKHAMERESTDVQWIEKLESISFEWDCKLKQSTIRGGSRKK